MTAYKTIAGEVSATYIEKKSKFIAQLCPAKSPDEALAFLEKVRMRHRKARHHVYAYLLRQGSITRYSDDGEPQGTAGVPVLDVMQNRNLTDLCCVVTRYFGGVLLGANGLVRAYSTSTKLALEQAQIQIMTPCFPVTLRMCYSFYGKVDFRLAGYDIVRRGVEFAEGVKLELFVKEEDILPLKRDLAECTGNRVDISAGSLQYADFSLDKAKMGGRP